MEMARCKQVSVCEKFENRLSPLASPMKRLRANQIYEMMMRVKNGLCMTANPSNFTGKILPTQDPQIRLRQNAFNELEALCPLPVAKINILNPSLTDEIHNIITIFMEVLPQNDIAFKDEEVAKRALSKRYREYADEDDINVEDFVYEVVPTDVMPKSNFAKVPMQLSKWYPGMYSVFLDYN